MNMKTLRSRGRRGQQPRFQAKYIVQGLIFFAAVWIVIVFSSHRSIVKEQRKKVTDNSQESKVEHLVIPPPARNQPKRISEDQDSEVETGVTEDEKHGSVGQQSHKNDAWDAVLKRAKEKSTFCQGADDHFEGFDNSFEVSWGNENKTLATLPSFGIINAIEKFRKLETSDEKVCELPPETECEETQFTVIFMAYNPDRLGITFDQIKKLLSGENFADMVKECILVWNGPRGVDESQEGRELLEYELSPDNALRVVYPLKMGFPNDLMNRYHPDIVKVTTKAILYYDDDGPFYSYKAVESGFELWKRHSRAQVGAMSRKINYSKRQKTERTSLDSNPNDRLFVSYCDNMHDKVEYNFYFFANFDANMVLPSGSMLHSNYLCFLWHPVMSEVRDFVLKHPVHPDDVTVSAVVSQLAGLAPRVYSRRLKPPSTEEKEAHFAAIGHSVSDERRLQEREEKSEEKKKPKGGIGGICWDCGAGMTEKKQVWADLRSQAVNAIIRYFGSINSGSIGWCHETEFYDPSKDGRCKPVMAKQGYLSWMNLDGTPKSTCP